MAIYYVDPLSGSDAAAGTSFGAAWKTSQKAISTAIAGDTTYLCATTIECITGILNAITNAGTNINAIKFNGANSIGTQDGTQYTIQASGAAGTVGLLLFAGTVNYTQWSDIIFDGNALVNNNIVNTGNDSSSLHQFYRSQFKRAKAEGVVGRGSNTLPWDFEFFGCRFNNNGGGGAGHGAGARGRYYCKGCKFDHNGGGGWLVNAGCIIDDCIVCFNTGVGLDLQSNAGDTQITNSIIYGNTTVGIQLFNATSRNGYIFVNNSIALNKSYGIFFQTGNSGVVFMSDYNHIYLNSSGATDLTGNLLPGNHNISGNPLFNVITDGLEDFRLLSGSPLIGAGINGTNIGAMPQIVNNLSVFVIEDE